MLAFATDHGLFLVVPYRALRDDLMPTCSTLNPKPQTLNPKALCLQLFPKRLPEALNHKPCTPNQKNPEGLYQLKTRRSLPLRVQVVLIYGLGPQSS